MEQDKGRISQKNGGRRMNCQCGQLKYWSECITPNCEEEEE